MANQAGAGLKAMSYAMVPALTSTIVSQHGMCASMPSSPGLSVISSAKPEPDVAEDAVGLDELAKNCGSFGALDRVGISAHRAFCYSSSGEGRIRYVRVRTPLCSWS